MSVVALRKESVDRNSYYVSVWKWDIVALRKESVDRNIGCPAILTVGGLSLSARRAWIEIPGSAQMWHTEFCRSPQGERG